MGASMESIYRKWVDTHKPTGERRVLIDRWWESESASTDAQDIQDAAERWLADGSRDKPDVLKSLALYGKSRLFTQGWTELPIEIPESEIDDWRAAGLEPTIEDHRAYQAAALGGFFSLAILSPLAISSLLVDQMHERVASLRNLLSLSLDSYTPTDWHQLDAEGVETDDGWFVELEAFDEPFVIYEDLVCFEWAAEKARMLAIGEDNPEVGLPSMAVYDELLKVDLNWLLGELKTTDPELRRVARHLVDHRYFALDSPIAPDQFWWRHMQASSRKGSSPRAQHRRAR